MENTYCEDFATSINILVKFLQLNLIKTQGR